MKSLITDARSAEILYAYNCTFVKWGLLVTRKWVYQRSSFVGVVWSAISSMVHRSCLSFNTSILSRQVPGFNTYDSASERQYVSLVYRRCILPRAGFLIWDMELVSISTYCGAGCLWSNDNTLTIPWVIGVTSGVVVLSDSLSACGTNTWLVDSMKSECEVIAFHGGGSWFKTS